MGFFVGETSVVADELKWGNITGNISRQDDLQAALNNKQDTLVSSSNIKTINNQSLLGSGNLQINTGEWGNITGDMADQTDLTTALEAKVEYAMVITDYTA